jgi:hypothetical protein
MDCSRISDRTVTDNLSKAGSRLGYVSAVDCEGRTIWIADAHRDDGKRFVVRADGRADCVSGTESTIHAPERAEDCGRREIKLDELS